MNLTLIDSLASLIREYWHIEIDEHLQSLNLTKNTNESITDFLKRINREGKDSDIVRITNSLLLDPRLQKDIHFGRQISNRPVNDWIEDLLSLFNTERYDTSTGVVEETTNKIVSNDATRPPLGPDQLREMENRRAPQQGSENESPDNESSNGETSDNENSSAGSSNRKLILKIFLVILGIGSIIIYISIDVALVDNVTIESPNSIIDSPSAATNSPGSIVNSPGATVNIPSGDKNKEASIDTVIETYRETRPYSISWTECVGSIPEITKEGEIISWTMHFTPIILDKDENPSLIPFHTIFTFEIRGFDINNSPMYIKEIRTSMHLVNPESRSPIILDLIENFKSVISNDVLQIQIWLLEEKFKPYSPSAEKNLVDYSTENRQDIMTDIRYNPESADWLKLDENILVCDNLFER